ncbi:MAG: hypothetical protein BWY76_02293 [bacterium ADurb.Bin429]|nr:MAG: hypothetical protein BWY76_02293 [bacterium ADurb.Bin429]
MRQRETSDHELPHADDADAELRDGDDADGELPDGDDAPRRHRPAPRPVLEGDMHQRPAQQRRRRLIFEPITVPLLPRGIRRPALRARHRLLGHHVSAFTAGFHGLDSLNHRWLIAIPYMLFARLAMAPARQSTSAILARFVRVFSNRGALIMVPATETGMPTIGSNHATSPMLPRTRPAVILPSVVSPGSGSFDMRADFISATIPALIAPAIPPQIALSSIPACIPLVPITITGTTHNTETMVSQVAGFDFRGGAFCARVPAQCAHVAFGAERSRPHCSQNAIEASFASLPPNHHAPV